MKTTRAIHGFQVVEYPELDSTNSEAERLLSPELPDRTVVWTRRQTRGRGQVGSHWESEPGKNLSLTLVLKPRELPAGEQFSLSMAVALGVHDFVSRHVEGCMIKWPNDIYVGDRKIAGILIEHTIMGRHIYASLCGIGVNINQSLFNSDAPNPVSLVQFLGDELPVEQALEELLHALAQRYRQVARTGMLTRDYLGVLYRHGALHSWEDDSGHFQATLTGINEYGQLLLTDTAGRERVYGFKEVKYL